MSGAWSPVWLVLGMGGLAIIAHQALLWQWPLPQCWLRQLTGVPCPSCGCTRSLASWAALDLAQAFRFNPLFFLLCAAVPAWSVLWFVEKCCRRTFLANLKSRLPAWPWWKIGLALLAVNWLYLCLALPK